MTGGTPSKTKPEYFQNGTIRWLVSGDIHRKEIHECEGRITESGLAHSNAKYLPINSVMMALNGQGKTRGTVALLRTKATCNQSMVSIYPKDSRQLLPEFLYLNLHGRYEAIRRITGDSGNDRRGLNMTLVRNISIPLPPLPEQKRIVAILDDAIAAIATATANAEKNIANARELFESELNRVFSQNMDAWITQKLGECFKLKSGDGLTKKEMVEGPFPVYGGNGIAGTHNKSNLSGGHVIIGRVGALCGNARHITEEIWLTDNAFQVVGFESDFNAGFLTYLLNAKNLRSLARHSAQPVISNSSLKDLVLEFPESKIEQERIVARLDELSAKKKSLVELYDRKVKALTELKQSILHKAFTDELTVDAKAADRTLSQAGL